MSDRESLEILKSFWASNRNLTFPFPYLQKVEPNGKWVRFKSGLPWLQLQLPIEIDWNRLLEEARSLDHLYVPHRSKGGHQGWSSLVIYGLGLHMTQNYEQYGHMDEPHHLYKWTEVCEQIPYTKKFFAEFFPYDSYSRIRFMKLEPGGFILPHTDSDVPRLGPINIALNQPAGCEFIQENLGLVPFEDRTLFNLDISRMHSVWNQSDENRYHIIVHGTPGEQWNSVLINSYLKSQQKRVENLRFEVIIIDDPEISPEEKVELIQRRLRFSLSPIPFVLKKPDEVQAYLFEISRKKAAAIVVAPGVFIRNAFEFVEEADRLISHLQTNRLPLAGQIIDWGGERIPFMHEQMIAINLSEWIPYSEIPLIESYKDFAFPGYRASKEKFHDHYTPHYIEPSDGPSKIHRPRWCTELMAAILQSGKPVINLPQNLRDQKIFSYPKDGNLEQENKVRTAMELLCK